jgi:acyl carrier protein, putative
MTRDEFLVEMQDVLQTEEDLTLDMPLAEIPEWDSLAIMSTMAFLDSRMGVKTGMADYAAMKTIGDIADKAGI